MYRDLLAFLVFVGFLLLIVAGCHYFWRVEPVALRRWAEGLGCEIVAKAFPGVFDLFNNWTWFGGSKCEQVYWLTLQDREGRTYRCRAKVGYFWGFPLSPARCPIRVRWGGPEPEPIKPKPVEQAVHPLRDREIDG